MQLQHSYLLVVVITTPNLQALSAIDASIRANSGIIFGLSIGMGVQVFISTYNKSLGCKTDKKKLGLLGGGAGSTALGSFFSFFSLVPLGCCGSWLFILSILPTIFGSGLSVALIQHSETLSYIGGYSIWSYRFVCNKTEERNAADKQYKIWQI